MMNFLVLLLLLLWGGGVDENPEEETLTPLQDVPLYDFNLPSGRLLTGIMNSLYHYEGDYINLDNSDECIQSVDLSLYYDKTTYKKQINKIQFYQTNINGKKFRHPTKSDLFELMSNIDIDVESKYDAHENGVVLSLKRTITLTSKTNKDVKLTFKITDTSIPSGIMSLELNDGYEDQYDVNANYINLSNDISERKIEYANNFNHLTMLWIEDK